MISCICIKYTAQACPNEDIIPNYQKLNANDDIEIGRLRAVLPRRNHDISHVGRHSHRLRYYRVLSHDFGNFVSRDLKFCLAGSGCISVCSIQSKRICMGQNLRRFKCNSKNSRLGRIKPAFSSLQVYSVSAFSKSVLQFSGYL